MLEAYAVDALRPQPAHLVKLKGTEATKARQREKSETRCFEEHLPSETMSQCPPSNVFVDALSMQEHLATGAEEGQLA